MSNKCTKDIKRFIDIALMPVGRTMYVFGGGWNKEDNGAGIGAKTKGLLPKWKNFFEKQNSDYNYKDFDYKIDLGLDCSGYIGWVLYNFFGEGEYVYPSGKIAFMLSKKYGDFIPKNEVKDYCVGDIMCSEADRHTFIVLGQCKDKSLLILHSSPPGVMINGTKTYNNEKSCAINLAEKYMSKHYPLWYDKFPNCTRSLDYLKNYNQFRWNKNILKDKDNFYSLDCETLMEKIFNVLD